MVIFKKHKMIVIYAVNFTGCFCRDDWVRGPGVMVEHCHLSAGARGLVALIFRFQSENMFLPRPLVSIH